jgi:hypothetical protein
MTENIGKVDRIARIIVALIMAGLYIGGVITGAPGLVMLGFGIFFVITSFFRFCPVYLPLVLVLAKRKRKVPNLKVCF